MTKDRRRFNPLVGLLVAIVGLIVLLVAQHIPNRHGMEADLTQRSEQALSSAGLSQVRVSFTGRDGTLRAGSPGEAERALGVVRALEGVRAAEAKVTPVPERTAPPSVVLALAGGRVSISGRVPTEAAQTALVAAAVAVFGTGAVDHRLTVDNSVTAAALSGLPEVLRALGRNAGDTTAELSDGRLVLTGALASAAGRAAVLAAAAGTGAAVVDQTRVADVQPQLTSLPSLTFPVGGVALTPGARASLVAAARILTANPDARIRIEGHTDSSGSAESNLAFSRTRARTVRDFLATQGVAAERMSTKGYGESQPKLSNTSAANRSVNRRVELVVSDGTPHQPGGGNGT